MSDAQAKEKSPRFTVVVMMALTGAVFFFVFLIEDFQGFNNIWQQAPAPLVLRYVAAMALGGALAGALFAGLFGRRGIGGLIAALLAGVLCSMVAGAVGSGFGILPDMMTRGFATADLVPIGFGLFVIPLSFVDHPYVLVVWLGLVIMTHVWARSIRQTP